MTFSTYQTWRSSGLAITLTHDYQRRGKPVELALRPDALTVAPARSLGAGTYLYEAAVLSQSTGVGVACINPADAATSIQSAWHKR